MKIKITIIVVSCLLLVAIVAVVLGSDYSSDAVANPSRGCPLSNYACSALPPGFKGWPDLK